MQSDNFNQGFKYYRVLKIYGKLMSGEIVNKTEAASLFGVTERTFQRDIEDLRCFFADDADDSGIRRELVYSREMNGYYLVNKDVSMLNDSETIALCKIMLDSRVFTKEEMIPVINKLLSCCAHPKSRRKAFDYISGELDCYIEPNHHKNFIGSISDISEAVSERKYMKIKYLRHDGSETERVIKPMGIMFSEFYFYLPAFAENAGKDILLGESGSSGSGDIFLSAYRLDRIQQFEVLDRHFDIPFKGCYDEKELRKRIQFLCGGKLRCVKFLYKGKNIEGVLDRFPASKIVGRSNGGVVFIAEVFGDGIDVWLRGQGRSVEILSN
ncbi:MAG: WYL domain-containing protein [Oscillospiraceae bacterium]|nr:WYL domain-containing protein [Oscillospiraceae bacterium]